MSKLRFGSAESNPDDRVGTQGRATAKPWVNWTRVLVYGLLPGLVLLLALAAGLAKWRESSTLSIDITRAESVRAAKDSTVALLSYQPSSVEKDVQTARDRLTGGFRESYIQVSREVLVPRAKEKHVIANASVPAAASVSVTEKHAVVLVFVDQTVTVGASPPAAAASSVRVTLDKIGSRWLVSGFDQT